MCGICGELLFEATADTTASDFEWLASLMARRGPDGSGSWSDGPCRLAFRRLAILDLSSAADQPMVIDGHALVFNGEVYNFRELRTELERLGVAFRSSGDTEVVLQALIHWGTAALDRFNGMFALALYDTRRRSLLLARDAMGVKPLYALIDRRGLFFASQYDQILAHPWAEGLSVAPEALGLYLRLGYVPAPYAMMAGTTLLEPGCWLEATADGDVRQGRYFAFPAYRPAELSGDAAYEAVDAAVTAAVHRQMISDVPLGAFLSGGIDSPLVAANAAAFTDHPLRAFTIGSDDAALDESADARAYAHRLGLAHVVEQYTPDKALDWLERVVEACGEPMADYSIFPTMLVSSLARREVTVALSGDGGDELFWGYAARFGAVMEQAAAFRQPYWMRAGRRAVHRVAGSSNSAAGGRWPTIGDWYRGVHSRLSDPALNGVFDGFPEWPAEYNLFRYDGWRADETAQWLRWNEMTGHLTRVLLKVDRASMYHSLEVRVPLLDREVLDVAARVDWRSCLTPNEKMGKLPLRRALARRLDFQSQAKRGFSVPMAEWLRGPLLPLLRDTVLSQPNLLGLPVQRPALAKIVDDHAAGRADQSRWLWTVLSLALWKERHLSRRAIAHARVFA